MDRSERRRERSWSIKEQTAADRRADRRRQNSRDTRRPHWPAADRPAADFQNWYREIYLASPHWRYVRQKKLEATDATCEHCGHRSWSNDVHHRTYDHLGAERLEDLETLCRRCHTEEHPEKQ